MKREAIAHTKMKRLCRRLNLPLWQAVGLMESIWHLTAREAPQGNLGKLSNEDIAIGIDYREDEDILVAALIASGWFDESGEHRLLVHDWPAHADDAVHMRLARARLTFASGIIPKIGRLPSFERAEAEAFFASVRTDSGFVRTDRQNVHTPCGDPAPPRQSPAPPEPIRSPSSSEEEKHKNGFSQLTTTDDKKYASDRDELVALLLTATGRQPEMKVVLAITEALEIHGGSVREYIDDVRPRIPRLRSPPGEGFFMAQAKRWGSVEVAPPAETAEEKAVRTGPCAKCKSIGIVEGGYCTCKMGKDLRRVEEKRLTQQHQEAS